MYVYRTKNLILLLKYSYTIKHIQPTKLDRKSVQLKNSGS